ncbi:DUF4132 domain-containing protein [Micromonospora purpureochromogenes]|uniref:DUF4132 domain-containing protein n=1 Tax=Micromonospora purpureochromogenes TaxID=47872 RepID=A0ABX2RRV5_9ACTN|nr:DUF4132 domain-containing protein [Micromonospora purpureochromogenes]NYF57943.1 hypothetical protein [Micromonospora purpureochromogenes]
MAAVLPDAALSPYAVNLLRVLTVPGAAEDNPIAREPVEASRLGDRELGVLLPVAYRLPAQHPAYRAIETAGRLRQPVFTPESCATMLSVLVKKLEQAGYSGCSVLAVNALVRCEGPLPEEAARSARKLVTLLGDRDRLDHPYALMALAGLGGGLTARIKSKLFAWSLHSIARDEVAVVSALGPTAQALLAEASGERSYYSPPQLPDMWQRLADMPEYASFAHRAIEAAHRRVADIQSGRIAYKADAAFERDEVGALGRVMRVALLRDEPWLMDLLRPLLLGVAVAPTAARTAPSQALLHEVARAIEDFPTPEALAALRAARAAARHKGVHKQLDRELRRIERALGDRPDVAFRLPDLGFGPDGVRTAPVGGYDAVITLSHDVDLAWRRADGNALAAVPAAVRRDHADTVKELRDLVKQARGHLATVARSLETGFTAGTTLPYRRWRDELAANGLGWSVVRRLIWEVPDASGEWRSVLPTGDGFADLSGTAVPEPEPDAEIRLWHPLNTSAEEIRGWRDELTDRELRQPFKQAFREVYLLTPAELQTETYSNRFAAHIVHYRQLYAVMKGRGWTCSRLGPWDGGDTDDAYRILPGGAWRVGFRHDYRDQQPDGVECASTDRVWFDRRVGGAWRPAQLADVPAIVLSEAMRDVDLFVSVTSIAADPHWMDRGDDLYADYWREASLAELTATAQTRRSALERIIPRTRLADRCELTERHLIVRGQLHTYKIHLGSANILMEPGNTYLCIVPSRRQLHERVFLPFEDDRLALILSKAFLLADDARITDPSIAAQLRAHR